MTAKACRPSDYEEIDHHNAKGEEGRQPCLQMGQSIGQAGVTIGVKRERKGDEWRYDEYRQLAEPGRTTPILDPAI